MIIDILVYVMFPINSFLNMANRLLLILPKLYRLVKVHLFRIGIFMIIFNRSRDFFLCLIKNEKGKGYMAINWIWKKAYDMLDWDLSENVLLIWVLLAYGLIGWCRHETIFKVILNGSTWYSFQAKQDIRQGDPLSPYIFIVWQTILDDIFASCQHRKSLL